MKRLISILCLTLTVLAGSTGVSEIKAASGTPNDITCIALLSIARDLAFQTGNNQEYQRLTSIQNKIILSQPHGAFPSSRIKTIKGTFLNSPSVRIPLTEKCISKWQ